MDHRIDVIGDVHGRLAALESLGRHLEYDIDHGWTHPEGRVAVFLGDLIDAGENSLAVAELVTNLVRDGRALCLMGNHEYNLIRHTLCKLPLKASNKHTVEDVARRRDRWSPILEFFRTLPLALDLPELRLIHAVWHGRCFERVAPVLHPSPSSSVGESETVRWLRRHVVLGSPSGAQGLLDSLPTDPAFPPSRDMPHEVLIKGCEETVQPPFKDAHGKIRNRIRVTWWKDPGAEIPTDKTIIFGHNPNLPPVPGRHDDSVPPYPSGPLAFRDWARSLGADVPSSGLVPVRERDRLICLDYAGVTEGTGHQCVGAYRWPEGQVAWAWA